MRQGSALPPSPSACIFQDLLDPARWRMLTQQFRYDNYRLHQLGNSSVFTLTLQAGLSAIKTPYPLRGHHRRLGGVQGEGRSSDSIF